MIYTYLHHTFPCTVLTPANALGLAFIRNDVTGRLCWAESQYLKPIEAVGNE